MNDASASADRGSDTVLRNYIGGAWQRAAATETLPVVNPATGKGDRVGFKFLEAQAGATPRKVRFFKSNGEVVDV